MRFAAVADIHGNLAALEAVCADLARHQVERVVNLGDHVSGPLWPAETAERLMELGWPSIAGNTDRAVTRLPAAQLGPSDGWAQAQLSAAQHAWLDALPDTLLLDESILLCHGTPASNTAYLLEHMGNGQFGLASAAQIRAQLGPTAATLVLCGHTHLPRCVQLPAGPLIVNPGSVGLPAYDHNDPELHYVETGAPHARYALLEASAVGWQVELVVVPYEHERAAALAEQRGRTEWARLLRTGYAR